MKHKIAIVICLATTTSLLLAQSWDFNNGSTAGLTVSNGGVHTGNGTGRSGYNFTGTSLSMYGSGNRYITLPAENTSNGGTLTFKLIYGSDHNGGEDPDMSPDEEVRLSYSTNNGSTWTINQYFRPFQSYFSWQSVTINLTGNLANSNIIFKLSQVSHSNSATWDHWAIDDLVLNVSTVNQNTAPTATAQSALGNEDETQ